MDQYGVVMKNKILGALAAVLLVLLVGGVQQYRINKLQKDLYTSELYSDSLEASTDTLKLLLEWADDKTNLWQQRAVQLETVNSDLAKKLNQQIRVANRLQLKIDSLTVTDTTNVVSIGDSIKLVSFEKYQEPYSIAADMSLNINTDVATSIFRIKLDPISLGVYVGCENTEGFRKAFVNLTTPKWATPVIESLEQDSGICNPKLSELSFLNKLDLLPWQIKYGVPLTITTIASLLLFK